MAPIAAPVTVTVAITEVTMKTPTRRRLGRLAGGRLRCCDNAVLPSAERCPSTFARCAGPLRYRAASRTTEWPENGELLRPRAGPVSVIQYRRGTTLPEADGPTKRFGRKSCVENPELVSRRSQFGNTYCNNYSP